MLPSGLQEPSPTANRPKTVKVEYAAGFRNYHPPKKESIASSECSTQDPNDIFSQLKIGNIKALYLESLPPEASNRKEEEKRQQESVLRLTITGKKGHEPEIDEEEQREQQLLRSQEREKFMRTYHLQQNYDRKANQRLLVSEFRQARDQLEQIYNKRKGRKQKYESLNDALCSFLIQRQSFLLKNKSQDEMQLQFANFLNQPHKYGQCKQTIKRDELEQIANGSIFWYVYLQPKSDYVFTYDREKVAELVREEKDIKQIKDSETVMSLLHKKYTVPYQTDLYAPMNKTTTTSEPVQQTSKQQQRHKAKLVPKTTYNPPKQRPKSSFSKTVTQPFNLTAQTQPHQTMDSLYNWDRSFKANPIPESTYKAPHDEPQKELYRQQRAKKLMKSAAYPASMAYLEQYGQHQQKRDEQLRERYQRNWTGTEGNVHHQIPNFQVIHLMDQANLQERIISNQKTTKCVPFTLSQPKPRKEYTSQQTLQLMQHACGQMKKKTMSSLPEAQSTLKFEAQVAKRKREQQQKEKRQEKAEKKEERKRKERSPYQQVLRQRLDDEVLNRPKAAQYPPQVSAESVKVNLDAIYQGQPLLMERQGAKRERPMLSWKPVI